jgi:hypothetical protein
LPIRVEPGTASRPLAEVHCVEYDAGGSWSVRSTRCCSGPLRVSGPSWDDRRPPFSWAGSVRHRDGAGILRAGRGGAAAGRPAALARRLGQRRAAAGHRAVGCGKSSLVRAGLAAEPGDAAAGHRGAGEACRLRVSRSLVDRLVADTENGEALPLLAFTLQELTGGLARGEELSAERYGRAGWRAGCARPARRRGAGCRGRR